MQQVSSTATKIAMLSVAAPAYNESESISTVVERWIEYLEQMENLSAFEIIICNDGSSDNTGKILDQLSSKNSCVKPVHLQINQGAAAALTTAIKHTQYPWVLLLDSDGQYAVENIDLLIAKLQETGSKAVIGVRTHKHDSLFTRFGSALSGSLCNMFHHTNYRDFNCALKLVDGNILRSLQLEAKGLNYSAEVSSKLIERGVHMEEVEVEHQKRFAGRSSSQNLRAAWHRMLFVFYTGYRQFLIRQRVLQVNTQ